MHLTRLSLSEAASLVARREISAVELTRAHLRQIERLEPQLNSFITVTGEAALRGAEEAERALLRGEQPQPLHGLPIALKDLFETAGVRTTAGSSHLLHSTPATDAPVVQRLRAAGAIFLGKLNMHEWAMSVTNINPHVGDCHNPWALDHIPGGSSGGAGAALAAELCMGALGSDTGGSVRIPAALCGVVGLKPTFGRISKRGALPLSPSLDHVGPMARRVRDVALLLSVLAGYDAADPYSADVPTEPYLRLLDEPLPPLRIALALDEFVQPGKAADPEVVQAVRAAARVFEQLGARVEELAIPGIGATWRLNSRMLRSDALLVHQERLRSEPQGFGADVLATLRAAERYPAVDYAQARAEQVSWRRYFESFFAEWDLLLTPATPTPAYPIATAEAPPDARPSLISYTAPFNFVGLPALSVPCGFSADGLPIGLQLVGARWAEARLLQAGHAYEQATPWHTHRPPLLTDTPL